MKPTLRGRWLSFKMAGFVECLNVSVATGVCLFEIVRQRKMNNA